MVEASQSEPVASVELCPGGNGQHVLRLSGRLEARALPDIWPKAVDLVRRAAPDRLVVDGSGIAYCDGAGLGLFGELRRLAAEGGAQIRFEGLTADLKRLIAISALADPSAGVLRPEPRPGLVVQVGRATAGILGDIRDIIEFTGQAVAGLAWAATHPHRVRYGDLWLVAQKAGVEGLPVVCLLGVLLGLISAFQAAIPLERFGAQAWIPSMVAVGMTRELGPLITAILLAGRSGSAFAAEIGTMKVTEELDALTTFGLSPIRFLIVPRILAAVIVTPILVAFNILLGVVGGYFVMAGLGYSVSYYAQQIVQSIDYGDWMGGIVKTFVFGLLVAAIGCQRGLTTKTGPGAVGDSTTRAVVAGIVLIILADGVFGVVYYVLGI
jgi:phospholipid/cholesterol/gamma-HCH transport system permease protein